MVLAQPAEVIRHRIRITRRSRLRSSAADAAAILLLNLAAQLHLHLLDACHRLLEELFQVAAHAVGITVGIEPR